MNKPKPITKEDVHKKVKIDGQFRLVEEYCYAYKVKSAVGWLKEIDNKRRHLTIKDTLNEFKDLGKLIIVTEDELNKAFEGVMQDNEVEE